MLHLSIAQPCSDVDPRQEGTELVSYKKTDCAINILDPIHKDQRCKEIIMHDDYNNDSCRSDNIMTRKDPDPSCSLFPSGSCFPFVP